MEHLEINVFPISFEKHVGFCIIAAVFFLLQFVRTKRWYQLVLAAAIPLSIVQSRKLAKAEAEKAAAEEAAKKAEPAVMADAPEIPEPAAKDSEQNTEE